MGEFSLSSKNLVFIDVETTGLTPQGGDAICEIGAVKFDIQERIVDKFHTLTNPKREIPPQASLIHGIYTRDVEDAPYFEEIVASLLDFLEDSILCGYNIGFDLGFINRELEKINYPPLHPPAIDVLLMARSVLPQLPRYSLPSVARYLNIEVRNFHRALQDSLLTREVFQRIRANLKDKGIERIEDILSLYGLNNAFFKKFQEPKLALIRECILAKVKVKIVYLDSGGRVSAFIVVPQGIQKNKDTYLVGKVSREEIVLNVKQILQIEIF